MEEEPESPLSIHLAKGRNALEQERDADALLALETALSEARLAGIRDQRVCDVLALLSSIYAGDYRKTDALRVLEEAADCASEYFGENSPQTTPYLEKLAHFLSRHNGDERAERLFHRCLSIVESEFGPDHIDVARLLRGWGLSEFWTKGGTEKVEKFLMRALSIMNKALPADDEELLEVAISLVDIFIANGRKDRAEEIINGQVERIVARGGKRSSVITLRLKLAAMYHSDGRYTDAFYKEIISEIRGISPIPASKLWLQLGWQFQYLQRQHDRALQAYLESLKVLENELGKEHAQLVETLDELGGLTLYLKEFNAIPYSKRLIEILEKVKGHGHTQTLRAMISLADIYSSSKQRDDAARLYELVAARVQEYNCRDKFVSTTALICLAGECYRRNEFARAQTCLNDCERILRNYLQHVDDDERAIGFLHTQLCRIFSTRIWIYKALGDSAAAAHEEGKRNLMKGATWAAIKATYV